MANINDVAKVASVSKATVSRILNGHGSFQKATVDKVMAAVKYLDYVPNQLARDLSNRRRPGQRSQTGVIAYLCRREHVDVLAERMSVQSVWIFTIAQEVKKRGYSLLIETVDEGDRESVPRTILENLVDGVIGDLEIEDEPIAGYLYGKVPFVLFNQPFDSERKYPAVVMDSAGGIGLAVRHLYNRGHRKIGYFYVGKKSRSYINRRAGFVDMMKKLKLKIDPFFDRVWDINPTNNDAVMTQFSAEFAPLVKSRRATAIVCPGSSYAWWIMHCLLREGLVAPRDYSITGFDYAPAPIFPGLPDPTRICPPFHEEAQMALDLISKMSRGQSVPPVECKIMPGLIEGQSTGPPAA